MNPKVPPAAPLETDSSADYSFQLRRFVSNQMRLKKRENRKKLTKRSPRLLEDDSNIGYIRNAAVIGSVGWRAVGYRFQVNSNSLNKNQVNIPDEFGVYPQNEVLVTCRIDDQPYDLEGTVVEIDGSELVVGFNQANTGEKIQKTKETLDQVRDVNIGVMLNATPFDRQKAAIRRVFDQDEKKEIVLGESDVMFTNDAGAQSQALDTDLYANERQKEGIEQALAADQVACLQGPPGTGKTRVFIEVVRRLVDAGRTVLVTAESNAALDNILVGASDNQETDERSLHHYRENEGLRVTRHNIKVDSVSNFVYEHYGNDGYGEVDVVASTNNSAETLDHSFDVAIVDEATQATKSSTMIPMSKTETLILVGDHQQLPPATLGQQDDEEATLRLSLFEHLYADDGVYGPPLGTRFNVQYRMNEEIAAFPSQQFYGGDLKNGCTVPSLNGTPPIAIFDVVGSVEDGHPSKKNEAEAEYVTLQVRMLIELKGVDPSEIGVAAAYADQATHIEDKLLDSGLPGVQKVTVNTFDAFQGSERTAMILSFTRSNDRKDIGFLSDDIGRKRLNVALTRAKQYCALVGNWDTLRASDDLYEDLYQYVTDQTPAKEITPDLLKSA